MTSISENITSIKDTLTQGVTLIAVSKTKPLALLQEAIDSGHLDLGENKVQELVEKHQALSKDVRWHMIGHLQRNKVKMIAPFVYMIHAVDSIRLLNEIDKRAGENQRKIKVLLQVHIAKESAKFGFDASELYDEIYSGLFAQYKNVEFSGLMGMATNTSSTEIVKEEFADLASLFSKISSLPSTPESFKEISMGMSNDYAVAIEEGSTMIRVGSSIFGARDYSKSFKP